MSLWTKIFGEPKPKEDWRLVKEVDVSYHKPQDDGTKSHYEFTYYLYESDLGNRKFDVVDSRFGDLDLGKIERMTPHSLDEYDLKQLYRFIHGVDMFRKTIRPWLDGRLNPKIPRYSDIPKEEFRDALAGERK